MGYYYGRAKAENKPVFHAFSLAVPILLHTLFDMFPIALMTFLGDRNPAELSAEEIEKLPNFNMVIPILVCTVIVMVITFTGIVIMFVNIKRKRESAGMQETWLTDREEV